MSKRLFAIDKRGNLTNCGKGLKSYEFDIAETVLKNTVGPGYTRHELNVRKLGQEKHAWRCNGGSVIVYVADGSGFADEALLRLCEIGDCLPEDTYFAVSDNDGLISLHRTRVGAEAAYAQSGGNGHISLVTLED